MLLKLELFLALSAKSDADLTPLLARRLKKYQESGPIKDAWAVVVLRTGNTGFPNVALCVFYCKRYGTMFIRSSLSNTLQVVENNCKDYPDLRKKKTNQIIKVTLFC